MNTFLMCYMKKLKEAWNDSLPWWVNPWSAYLEMKRSEDFWYRQWVDLRVGKTKKIRKPKNGGRK
jgi:hypothetical protein